MVYVAFVAELIKRRYTSLALLFIFLLIMMFGLLVFEVVYNLYDVVTEKCVNGFICIRWKLILCVACGLLC